MDLNYTPAQQAFRQEVRAWMRENVPGELPDYDTWEGFEAHRAWEQKLGDSGWGMVTWPEALGGRGCDLFEWLIFEEEYYAAGAPLRLNQNGIFLLGPTLMEFGTDAQKARFLPRMARCDDMWAQAWSEPGAGSDMAAIRTTAYRDGDHYVINGQKTWSTRARWADWIFGLFRSEQGSQRHHGLSYLMVPLDAPGVTVRPIRQLNGLAGFAEIFFDEVRVPVDNRLGEEGEGWSVAMATAGFERGLMLRSPARYQATARRLAALYRAHPEAARRDPALRERVAAALAATEAYALSTYRTVSLLAAGGKIGPEASTSKIFWSELDLQLHEAALAILGSHAELDTAEARRWMEGFMFAQAGPIYAGSNEIQRNIIAERMLGLPR